MKVVQILPALERGGVEKGTLEISAALVLENHESWVISAGGQLVSQLEDAGGKHVTWDLGKKSLSNLFNIPKLRKWLLKHDFDIIHVRSRMPAWIVWLAWRKLPRDRRPRLVTTLHGLHSVNRYSEIMTVGERVIAVSKTGIKYITENYPRADRTKIELIYRGIDPSIYHPNFTPSREWLERWHQQFPKLKGQILIALPGRLTRLKGHLQFIDIIHSLRKLALNVKGVIIGGHDPKHDFYLLEIQSKINQLQLDNDIILTGDRSDLREIMSISTAVLSLSSKPESFGRTVLESLSLGTPTYGYEHGGVGEILDAVFEEGKVKTGDDQEVINKLSTLLKSDNESKQKIISSINSRHEFTLNHMCQKTLDLYSSLVTEKKT